MKRKTYSYLFCIFQIHFWVADTWLELKPCEMDGNFLGPFCQAIGLTTAQTQDVKTIKAITKSIQNGVIEELFNCFRSISIVVNILIALQPAFKTVKHTTLKSQISRVLEIKKKLCCQRYKVSNRQLQRQPLQCAISDSCWDTPPSTWLHGCTKQCQVTEPEAQICYSWPEVWKNNDNCAMSRINLPEGHWSILELGDRKSSSVFGVVSWNKKHPNIPWKLWKRACNYRWPK